MNQETIELLRRFVAAHEKLADAHARIADALHYTEGKIADLTFADGLVFQIAQLGASLDQIVENMPVPPDGGD